MVELISFWVGAVIGSALQASGTNDKAIRYLGSRKKELLKPMPTDTDDKWINQQNEKLNQIPLIRIYDEDA